MLLEKREKLNYRFGCPACNSSNTYCRVKTNDYVCRKCGNVFKKAVVKEERKD